ncbi:MAG: hypothetical protein ABI556_06145 [Gemmatimonadales bacterium]
MLRRRILSTLAVAATAGALAACAGDPVAPSARDIRPLSFAQTVEAPSYGQVGPSASSNAALHAVGFLCSLGPAGLTTDSRIVANAGGVVSMVCHTDTGVGPQPALNITGELCSIGGILTTDMHFTWSPSGQATLTCRARLGT